MIQLMCILNAKRDNFCVVVERVLNVSYLWSQGVYRGVFIYPSRCTFGLWHGPLVHVDCFNYHSQVE